MPSSLKVVAVTIGPSDTDFGVARVVKLSDGSGRIEVFEEASKSWAPSPKGLTVGDVSDGRAVSPALAKRLGLNELTPMDPDEGFSPEGLKAFEKMIANGYDPRTLSPSPTTGRPVYDRDLDDELNGYRSFREPKKE